MSRRGRQATLPQAGAERAWGLRRSGDSLMVRCFDEAAGVSKDYDFSRLGTSRELTEMLAKAFASRTAPGGGLTSLDAMNLAYRAAVQLAEHVATLVWRPAAAGIEPILPPAAPVVVTAVEATPVSLAKSPAKTPSSKAGQQNGQAAESADDTLVTEPREHGHSQPAEDVLESPVRSGAPGEEHAPTMSDVDYYDAFRACAEMHGAFPTPLQFGVYLAETYGVTDESTGRSLAQETLEPLLAKLRELTEHSQDDPRGRRAATAEQLDAPPTDTVVAERERAVAVPHPFFERTPSAPTAFAAPPAPRAAEPQVPEPAPTAVVGDGFRAGWGTPEQTSLDLPSARPAEPAPSDPALWGATATDSGAATARLPEEQGDEPELTPAQQQIVTVAEWLAEAKEAGEKLSGAEVARRLSLSPRTGQRRLDKAAEYLAEQRRQVGRSHLRSVRS